MDKARGWQAADVNETIGRSLAVGGDGHGPDWALRAGTLLALGYLRHIRAARCSAEKGSARAPKGLDDVAPRAKVAPGPVGPRNGGTNDGR